MSFLARAALTLAALTVAQAAALSESAQTDGGPAKVDSKTGILLVAFGTSDDEGRAAYAKIENAISGKYPSAKIKWGFTSGMVRAKLMKRGVKTLSPQEALSQMAAEGVDRIAVQSLHICAGSEFHELAKELREFASSESGSKIKCSLGRPLLVSGADLDKLVAALPELCPKGRTKDDAIVLFGHGNAKGNGDLAYIAAALAMSKADKLAFMATVEGRPSFEEAIRDIKASGAKKAFLVPFMLVAGDHVRNDMGGDEEGSLKNLLKKEGVESVPVIRGLAESKCVADIYLAHLEAALKELEASGDGK